MALLKHKDFLPEQTDREGLFGGVDFSEFDSCVDKMNRWLASSSVEIVRVETVVLPNIFNQMEEGSADTELHSIGHTMWHQFVRLWYYEK